MICMSVCSFCQTKLQVTVTHIKGQKGDIIVGIFDNDKDFLKKPIHGKMIKASGDSVTVVFDANKNKDLDKNKLGIPKEGFGFSNNVIGAMGPPSFERAQIDLSSDQRDIDIDIKMKYM